jgi:glycosyltransferase involved in cell wall biosynthesis
MTAVLVAFGGYPGTPAGAERMAWRTVEELTRTGYAVTVRTDSTPPPHLRRAGVALAGPDLTAGPADVVHAFDLGKPEFVRDALARARHGGVPFALTPATDASVWPEPEFGRIACREAEVIYALTRAEADALVGLGAGRDRIRLIPSAPDLVGRPDPDAFRRRLGVDGPIVLFVGRRTSGKGYPQLLASMPLVWQACPETAFVLAGPDAETEGPSPLRPPTDSRVFDLGVVDDRTKHDAIAACAVLCLPTSADVFPLVFVEAWSCGRPVVAGHFPGVHEVVRHGIDGLIVDPRPDRIAPALVTLLSDDAARTAIGRAGLARAQSEMTWQKMVAQVAEGYPLRPSRSDSGAAAVWGSR